MRQGICQGLQERAQRVTVGIGRLEIRFVEKLARFLGEQTLKCAGRQTRLASKRYQVVSAVKLEHELFGFRLELVLGSAGDVCAAQPFLANAAGASQLKCRGFVEYGPNSAALPCPRCKKRRCARASWRLRYKKRDDARARRPFCSFDQSFRSFVAIFVARTLVCRCATPFFVARTPRIR